MKSLRDAAALIPAMGRLRHARDALLAERDALAARLYAADRRPLQHASSPFLHYNACFDPVEVMRRHAVFHVNATAGYLTNFLGVRIDPKVCPSILAGRAGEVEPIPIPANWHADIAEWGAALRAVDLARHSFTVVELGCGWGCWLNNTGVAARRAGLDVHLIGVEADEGHLGFAREACAVNGFTPDQVSIYRGVAAANNGIALFPHQHQPGEAYGLEPVFGATEQERRAAAESGRFDELPMIPLSEVAGPHARVDLLHIDIQGGEADYIAGCLPLLGEKVAYMLVGTHSRQIEGATIAMLLQAGWRLEIERPAIFALVDGQPRITVDGVQGWRNPALHTA